MPKIKTCQVCDEEFEVRPAYYARSKYCSQACYGISKRTQQSRTCKNCKDDFMFKPSQLNHYKGAGRFCSRKCGYEYRVKINANRPSDDLYGRTNRKADIAWREAIRKKFNNTCQRCYKYDLFLHTHHIRLRSQRPDLKHDLDNGITLCSSCHTWVHRHPIAASKLGLIIGGSY